LAAPLGERGKGAGPSNRTNAEETNHAQEGLRVYADILNNLNRIRRDGNTGACRPATSVQMPLGGVQHWMMEAPQGIALQPRAHETGIGMSWIY
jgi:hypothetical protein